MRVELGTGMVLTLIGLGFGLYYIGKHNGRKEAGRGATQRRPYTSYYDYNK